MSKVWLAHHSLSQTECDRTATAAVANWGIHGFIAGDKLTICVLFVTVISQTGTSYWLTQRLLQTIIWYKSASCTRLVQTPGCLITLKPFDLYQIIPQHLHGAIRINKKAVNTRIIVQWKGQPPPNRQATGNSFVFRLQSCRLCIRRALSIL